MLSLIKRHISQQRIDKTISVIEAGDLPALLKLLPKLDADWLNQPKANTPSLLELSIAAQQPTLVEQLINAGADPNQTGLEHESLLVLARSSPPND
jgi:hypothetical protein